MKSKLLFVFTLCCLFAVRANADERLLVNENFQTWADLGSSTTETVVTKTTSFTNETLEYKLSEILVDPDGRQEAKFNYTDESRAIVSDGYLMCAKTATPYIELSPLASVTRVEFIHGATGSSRGYKLEKKVGDGDWEVVSSAVANPSSGTLVSAAINGEHVALRFTNLNPAQNAYLFDLRIYGDYESTAPQVTLATEVAPAGAGSIIQSPSGDQFDEGTQVSLTAERKFGYRFSGWTDANGTEISTENPLVITLNENTTVKAVFTEMNTYSLKVNVSGGANSYLVTASPKATVVDGISYYEEGTEVKLTAANNRILTFTNWDDNTTSPEKVLAIGSDVEVTANYSASGFIVGWDLQLDEPKSQRAADYYDEPENRGMMSLRTAANATAGWLAKGLVAGKYEGRYGAVNWQPLADRYYYEISFATTGYTDVKVSAAMLCNYNAYSVQNVEYSLDGAEFTKVGDYTFGAVKNWYDAEFALPEAAWGQEKVYVRFIPDYTSEIIGTTAANDGTSIADIFVTAEKGGAGDEIPPMLLSALPGTDATGVSASGSIVLTFDERVIPGTGDAVLNGETLTGVFSGKTVIYQYSALSYNTLYTFSLPAGAITDRYDNPFGGCEFSFTTMERTQAPARLFDAVVAQDGSGDYTSVAAAIAAAPANRVSPWLIFIKEGIYKEHVEVPANKPFMYLIGQDVEKVIITDDQLCGGDPAVTGKPVLHVSLGATVVVQASDFFAENIAFENSWGIDKNDGPQALALYTNNDRVVLQNCKLRSYQDTYLSSTNNMADRHYLKNCFIEGAVDFIYGGGDVFFDGCELYIVRKSGGYIVAPSHKSGTAWGYVFMNNTISAPAPANETSVWLGRPWKDAPKTVFINTMAEVTIPAAGWFDHMGAIPAVFADYNTMDGNGDPVDLSNRIEDYWYDDNGSRVEGKAKKNLTPEEAAQYSVRNVLAGSDNWQPQLLTEKTGTPEISVSVGNVSWPGVDYAISYVVYLNGKVIAFTTENEYQVTSVQDNGLVSVQAVAESGALSPMSNVVLIAPTALDERNLPDVGCYAADGFLNLSHLPSGCSVEIYALQGNRLLLLQDPDENIRIKMDQSGIVRIVSPQGTAVFKVMR